MGGHQRVVLQQGERPLPVERRRGERGEGSGRPQHEHQVEALHREQDGHRGGERLRPPLAEPERHCRDETGQDQVPQQERTLVRGPQ